MEEFDVIPFAISFLCILDSCVEHFYAGGKPDQDTSQKQEKP